MEKLVWSFAEVKELNNETGFVVCDATLAVELIKEGKAQDPLDGALYLSTIGTPLPVKKAPKKTAAPKPNKA